MRNWVWVQECGKSGPGARVGGEGRGPSRGQAAVSVGGGGAWPGFKPTRRAAEQRPGPTGVEGAGGAGGPGCGARGRWWGMVAVPVGGGRARAGLEIDRSEPSGSRVAISRAGRRPPAHRATRPNQADHAQWTTGGPPPTGASSSPARQSTCDAPKQQHNTAIKTAETQRKLPAQTAAFTASQQHAEKSYGKYESFIGSS